MRAREKGARVGADAGGGRVSARGHAAGRRRDKLAEKKRRRWRSADCWAAGLTFLMIMTRKGSLMPSVFDESAGQETKVVEMLVDMISRTDDWMSLSVMRLM